MRLKSNLWFYRFFFAHIHRSFKIFFYSNNLQVLIPCKKNLKLTWKSDENTYNVLKYLELCRDLDAARPSVRPLRATYFENEKKILLYYHCSKKILLLFHIEMGFLFFLLVFYLYGFLVSSRQTRKHGGDRWFQMPHCQSPCSPFAWFLSTFCCGI